MTERECDELKKSIEKLEKDVKHLQQELNRLENSQIRSEEQIKMFLTTLEEIKDAINCVVSKIEALEKKPDKFSAFTSQIGINIIEKSIYISVLIYFMFFN